MLILTVKTENYPVRYRSAQYNDWNLVAGIEEARERLSMTELLRSSLELLSDGVSNLLGIFSAVLSQSPVDLEKGKDEDP